MNPLEDWVNDGYFCNAHRLSFNQATFNLIHGNMTNSHSGEQRSHVRGVKSITAKKLITVKWNTYWWVDFDQKTLWELHTSSKGIVTREMKLMVLTELCIKKVLRIHSYDRQDIFEDHLKFVKSPCVLLSWCTISWILTHPIKTGSLAIYTTVPQNFYW